jgi:hypothetical protein
MVKMQDEGLHWLGITKYYMVGKGTGRERGMGGMEVGVEGGWQWQYEKQGQCSRKSANFVGQ